MSKEGGKDTYYHYTSAEGAKAIADSGIIMASRESGPKDDAVFGDGTYLTQFGPENPTEAIVYNNYDSARLTPQKIQELASKTEYVVQVEIPKHEVEKIDQPGRDVHKTDGNLNLEGYDHQIYPREDSRGSSGTSNSSDCSLS